MSDRYLKTLEDLIEIVDDGDNSDSRKVEEVEHLLAYNNARALVKDTKAIAAVKREQETASRQSPKPIQTTKRETSHAQIN